MIILFRVSNSIARAGGNMDGRYLVRIVGSLKKWGPKPGRHDPVFGPRANSFLEAICTIAVFDFMPLNDLLASQRRRFHQKQRRRTYILFDALAKSPLKGRGSFEDALGAKCRTV